MLKITITIDGYEVVAPVGKPLLDIARESGFYIPGLCSHPELKPQGTCGLCVVEIHGFDEPQLSCEVIPEDGMIIRTSTPLLKSIREEALAAILSEHPHACLDCDVRFDCEKVECKYDKPVYDRCCDYFHECELRLHTDYMGVPEETTEYKPQGLPQFTEKEILYRNYELCIQCTRCARVCRIAEGLDIYRDYFPGGKLDPSKIKALEDTDCTFCGYCVDACPTGAISLLETDFGFAGYFPMGTSGRLSIPVPPPSHKMPLDSETVSMITTNPGRVNIYDIDGYLIYTSRSSNLRAELTEQLRVSNGHTFTIQPDY